MSGPAAGGLGDGGVQRTDIYGTDGNCARQTQGSALGPSAEESGKKRAAGLPGSKEIGGPVLGNKGHRCPENHGEARTATAGTEPCVPEARAEGFKEGSPPPPPEEREPGRQGGGWRRPSCKRSPLPWPAPSGRVGAAN